MIPLRSHRIVVNFHAVDSVDSVSPTGSYKLFLMESSSTAQSIHDSLTPVQLDAVNYIDGPLLILAGPGSGKTRVVTHRIANLILRGIPPRQILALTFTNKAADEMQTRLERLVPRQPVWMGTFHRFCARLLRQHASLVGLQENYSIYDTQDSTKALKQAVEVSEIALTHTSLDSIAQAISWAKNELISADTYKARHGSAIGNLVAQIYPHYQRRLLESNAVDFDDLLLHVATLLQENPELRQTLDTRFRYICVDEYQDTNSAQYAIVRALSVDYPNLMVTGDPDQSIYGWRGANLNNILEFEQDYPNVHVVRLEHNYRSTPNILRAADQLITHNLRRKEKSLFTDRDEGAPVRLLTYPSSRDEADAIAEHIATSVESGQRRLRDFAVFYRVNALSRSIENALRVHNLPYRVIAGLEFFQRKEIKDLLAYLHLLNNPNNDVALLRIINTPPRKIGKKTVEQLTIHARRYHLSMLEAARESGLIETLTKRSATAVAKFVSMYDRLALAIEDPLQDLIASLLDESNYRTWLEASESDEDANRLANTEELLTAAKEFDEQFDQEGRLEEFLEQTALVSDTDMLDEEIDRITLMTLHAAKGLEFPVVFLTAVEEGLLPHERSREDSEQLEEERRLMFVGMTRAEDELRISLAQYRDFRGQRNMTVPSSFLSQLPREEMEILEPVLFQDTAFHDDHEAADEWIETEFRNQSSESAAETLDLTTHPDAWEETPSTPQRYPAHLFKVGMIVDHPNYGSGTIVEVRGTAKKRTATVDFFGSAGQRKFRLAHCPLVPAGFDEI